MTLQEILALLMGKFSGTRKDGLMQMARMISLQCTTKEEAEELVNKLTDAQVSEFVKNYRADVDKEVNDGIQTNEANLRKKYDLKEKTVTNPNPEPGGSGGDNNNIADIIQAAVAEAVKPYATQIEAMKANEVSNARLQRLNEALSGCKDETFKAQTMKDFKRMSFADDAAFDEYLTEKTTDITTANQSYADTNMGRSGGAPLFSNKDNGGVSKAVADYVAAKNPANNQFSGKEL